MGQNSGIFLGGVSQGFNNTFLPLQEQKLASRRLDIAEQSVEQEKLFKLAEGRRKNQENIVKQLGQTFDAFYVNFIDKNPGATFDQVKQAFRPTAEKVAIPLLNEDILIASAALKKQVNLTPEQIDTAVDGFLNSVVNPTAAAKQEAKRKGEAAAIAAQTEQDIRGPEFGTPTVQNGKIVQTSRFSGKISVLGDAGGVGGLNAQSPIGKLLQDREMFVKQYGEGSEQVAAFDSLMAAEDDPKPATLTDKRGIRQEYTKLSGTFIERQSSFQNILSAVNDPSAAGDLAIIFGFMKMLDPESVVREGEQATAQNAAGVPDRIRNAYNRVLEGTRLTPEQRADFASQAQNVYNIALQSQRRLEKEFGSIAERAGIDPKDVAIDFVLPTGGVAKDPIPLPKSLQSMTAAEILDFLTANRGRIPREQLLEIQSHLRSGAPPIPTPRISGAR